ncbi:MAG: fumarylacetoacetase [Acidobacteriaceae bacterium]|nr:fumarylacetoacetase [Acidobacteriaceae bacterium]
MAVIPSWIESANDGQTDFPVTNLPFGIFQLPNQPACIGAAIGDQILDLRAAEKAGLLAALGEEIAASCKHDSLNALMAVGREASQALRLRLMELLSQQSARSRVEPLLVPQASAKMLLPARIGDYTDFYASIYHATNVGRLFRPDNPLLPNYKYVPIGYHGRASSILVSGTEIQRPCGQTKAPQAAAPSFGPSRALDYELEVGFFVGRGNPMGQPVPIAEAESRIFGLCLLNDWSARDIQAWEYQPLGPFLAKNFATTISPWVITMDALEPFRVPPFVRQEGDPEPLSYHKSAEDHALGGIDLKLEVWLRTGRMRSENLQPVRLSQGNLRDLYWTLAQMLTHHASNGCNLQSGDLLATGTVSGVARDSLGCLLEITRRGAEPLQLPNGETRKFLEDGDEVIFRGYCEREGHARIGFGECRGLVLPARSC